MEHSATFARLFARLVWLLVDQGESVEEQKLALRAVVAIGRHDAVRISVQDDVLYADGEVVLAVLPGVPELSARMAAAGLGEVNFDRQPAAGEMLGLARALSLVDPEAPDSAGLRHALDDLKATTLRFVMDGAELARSNGAEPAAAEAAVVAVAEPALVGDAAAPAAEAASPDAPRVEGLVPENSQGMFFQFSSIGTVKDSPEALLAHLARATDQAEKIRVLDDAVTLTETAAREGKAADVVDLMRGLVAQEADAPEGDVNRAFVMALRRLTKPLLLRTVAAQVVAAPDRGPDLMAILTRMGQDGAEAVIDQVSQAATTDARGALLQVLRQLEATVPALAHMLGDARWFVARNAADLLGELKATGAEDALVQLLRHDDERVRRSATNALMQLGSESARQAVRAAVRDGSPQVRMQAAFAIAAHRDPQTATTLIMAIDAEEDSDVQLAMLLALGRVGTPDAVERLIKAAEPAGGFFKKKPTAFRVAAVQALAEARSPAAQAALHALASDKDRDVRDTVIRLTKQARRR
ncbi:MAG TPA: HEAT repeat domain-containing protein [Gemmatimonadaceae bacterium]|nr:HEAT repeat domain-containing protein [Gemmatimonadaceae bacterium]